jgi:glutathione S-transferase
MIPTLTYFSSRGRAELIRLVCADAGLKYNERSLGVYHPVDKTPDFHALKATGVLAFGFVPLWEEEGLRLAQTNAIVRHLARTNGLYGSSPLEAARCDMLFEGYEEVRLELRRIATAKPEDRAAVREELTTSVLPRWLSYFEALIAANGAGTYLVGASASFADLAMFHLFESFRDNELVGLYDACPKLKANAVRVGERPGVAAYLASAARFPIQYLPK